MSEYTFRVYQAEDGLRLDIFLTQKLSDLKDKPSRTSIQKIITTGDVKLKDSEFKLNPHYKVKEGEEFVFCYQASRHNSLLAEDIDLDVVYEDKDLAIINKQQGLVVHPAPGNTEHTLVNALLGRFKSLSTVNPLRPGIVHRLDKETSGLMVIAKNNFSHLELVRQFAKHTVKKRYIALVRGCVDYNEGVIELPVGRHPLKRKSMAVGFGKNTKYAKTYYRTLKRTQAFSLLDLELFTGRTHQLRVHLAHIGHPILGDNKYGSNNEFKRLALHAYYLEFNHPASGKLVKFILPIPDIFIKFSGYKAETKLKDLS